MINKIKRNKTPNRQDMTKAKSVDELIKQYDFTNKDIYDFLDYLVDYLNERGI